MAGLDSFFCRWFSNRRVWIFGERFSERWWKCSHICYPHWPVGILPPHRRAWLPGRTSWNRGGCSSRWLDIRLSVFKQIRYLFIFFTSLLKFPVCSTTFVPSWDTQTVDLQRSWRWVEPGFRWHAYKRDNQWKESDRRSPGAGGVWTYSQWRPQPSGARSSRYSVPGCGAAGSSGREERWGCLTNALKWSIMLFMKLLFLYNASFLVWSRGATAALIMHSWVSKKQMNEI